MAPWERSSLRLGVLHTVHGESNVPTKKTFGRNGLTD